MAINKLYISSEVYDWNGADSFLLSAKNIKKVVADPKSHNYHTSIDDLRTQNLQIACQLATEIYLVDIDLWTISGKDFLTDGDQYSYGRLFYELTKVQHKVKNFTVLNEFSLDLFNSTNRTRLVDEPVLWTAGCSFTSGEGVTELDRYGTILSKMLNRAEISLSQTGSSIIWAADQILKSDIRCGDIVVWGLTTVQRFEYAENWKIKTLPYARYNEIPKGLRYWPIDYFDSTVHIIQTIRSIMQVINFCNKVGAKLYLANLLDITWILPAFNNYNRFIDLTKEFLIFDKLTYIDYGTDGLHPGPITHKWYAEKIFDFINKTV